MPFRLSKKCRYSPLERRVFSSLGGKPKSTLILVDRLRAKGVEFHSRISVVAALRSLQTRAVLYGEPFRIASTPRRGPHPVKFWLEELQ
jgi:hypothetical protein